MYLTNSFCGLDSVVGIATRLRTGRSEVRILVEERDFPVSTHGQTAPGPTQTSLNCEPHLFDGGKVPERGFGHPSIYVAFCDFIGSYGETFTFTNNFYSLYFGLVSFESQDRIRNAERFIFLFGLFLHINCTPRSVPL